MLWVTSPGRFANCVDGRAGIRLHPVGCVRGGDDRMSEFIIAQSEENYREAAVLLREYEASLGIDLCFQGFPEELESLERMYGPPGGRFLLLRVEEGTAGCVALVDSSGNTCEMKRLYVRPAFRGRGLGRRWRSKSSKRRGRWVTPRCVSIRCPPCARPSPCTAPWDSGKSPLTTKLPWRVWCSWS